MDGNPIARQLEDLLQAHIIESGRMTWRDPAGVDLGLPD